MEDGAEFREFSTGDSLTGLTGPFENSDISIRGYRIYLMASPKRSRKLDSAVPDTDDRSFAHLKHKNSNISVYHEIRPVELKQ